MRTQIKYGALIVFGFISILVGIEILISSAQAKRVRQCLEEVRSIVSIGDDIYEAKQQLVDNGFLIISGPNFVTKDKSYRLMHIDYGESPSTFERLMYAMDLGGGSDRISGIIRADPTGRITEIE